MEAEVRGRYITMTCTLLETKPAVKEEALRTIFTQTGRTFDKLDPDGWYPVKLYNSIFDSIATKLSAISARAACKVVGSKVYPTMKAQGLIPAHITSPSELLKFEADGFLASYRGQGILPRKFIKDTPHEVVVQADMPMGLPPELMTGVFEGILRMCAVRNGQVDCEDVGGHPTYKITWA